MLSRSAYNTQMRSAALLGAFFLLCAPVAHAETLQSKVNKEICKPGTVRKEARTFNPGGEQSSLKKMVVEGNLCTNDKMIVNRSDVSKVYEELTCVCPMQQEPDRVKKEAQLLDSVGCGKDQQGKAQRQTTVAITIPRDISGCTKDTVEVSKCATDLEKAYEAGCKRGANVSFIGTDTAANISVANADTDRNFPSLGLSPQSDMLVKALTDTGVPLEKAQELAKSDRQGAAEYIEAMASKDIEKAKAKAEALGINPDLANDQRALEAAKQAKKDLSDNPLETNPNYRSGPTTFSSPDSSDRAPESGRMQCGTPGIAGPIMRHESTCGATTVNPLEPGVRGPYQFQCNTWNSYARNTGNSEYQCACTSNGYYAGICDAVNDRVIGGRIVNGQYDLFKSQYGSSCASTGTTWAGCSYVIHMAGEGAYQKLVLAHQQDPNTPLDREGVRRLFGSYDAYDKNRNVFAQAPTVGALFQNFDSKMNNTPLLAYSGPTGGSYSAFGGITGGGSQSLYYNNGSPLGQANIFGNLGTGQFGGGFGGLNLGQLFQQQQQPRSPYQQQQYPYQPPQQAPAQQPIQQPPPIPMVKPPVIPPVVTPTSTPTSTPTQTPTTAIANLTIAPKVVALGDPFVVSWTSVGMKSEFPCILSQSGKEIARGANGARQITVPFATSSEYLLTCVASSGQAVQKKETVTVK